MIKTKSIPKPTYKMNLLTFFGKNWTRIKCIKANTAEIILQVIKLSWELKNIFLEVNFDFDKIESRAYWLIGRQKWPFLSANG
jgi:hypothetical protein